jgi:hypothetical protein
MKSRMQEDEKLTFKDKSNLNIAIKQTTKLAKFSLRKRINILKNEWWYWNDITQSQSLTETSTDEIEILEDQPKLLKHQENDTEEILQLFSTNTPELVHTKKKLVSAASSGLKFGTHIRPGMSVVEACL